MELSDYSKHYYEKMFPGHQTHLCTTDPELIERFQNFAFDEVVNSDDLDGRTRFIAILSALLGCQGTDLFRDMLPATLNFGVTPIEIREIVYQAVAYLGMGRVFPFLNTLNEALTAALQKKTVEAENLAREARAAREESGERERETTALEQKNQEAAAEINRLEAKVKELKETERTLRAEATTLRAAAEEKARRESVLQSEIAGFVGFGRGYEE